MFLKIFAIVFLIALQGSAGEEHCHKLLRELAYKESLFAQCATVHSVPVKICTGCKDHFGEMDAAFAAIKNETNCTSMYFDKDRVNIVAATEEALARLWNKAYCDDCYRNDNIYTFDNKSSDFYGCINKHIDDPCDQCVLQYMDLNNFYIQMDQHNNGKVCFDLQDSMNRTRNKWSKELKCCRREFNMTLFTAALCIVGILPFLFYGGTYLLTKRQERNHSMLNDEDPLFSSSAPSTSGTTAPMDSRNIPPTTSSSIHRTEPADEAVATSSVSRNGPKSEKPFNKLEESTDDSSDEENLAKKL